MSHNHRPLLKNTVRYRSKRKYIIFFSNQLTNAFRVHSQQEMIRHRRPLNAAASNTSERELLSRDHNQSDEEESGAHDDPLNDDLDDSSFSNSQHNSSADRSNTSINAPLNLNRYSTPNAASTGNDRLDGVPVSMPAHLRPQLDPESRNSAWVRL